MKRLLSFEPIALDQILGIVRMFVGLLLIYHGQEVFHSDIMAGYLKWDTFRGPMATVLVYSGKASELLGGLLLFGGLLTRFGALLVVGTFLYITFNVGSGRFWYEDQHPFMFALFGFLFFFAGPGRWSLDERIFSK